MESAVLIFTAVGSLGVFVFRGQTKYFFSLFLHILLIVTASSWAFRALSAGGLMQFNLLEQLSLSLSVNIDSLSAFFLVVISLTMLTGVLYAHGYLNLYRQTRSDLQLALHHLALLWLHISMILVCTLREGTSFLVAWELMAVSSFGLVVFEAERKEILRTGLNYLLQMQIGLVLMITAFLIVHSSGHAFGFDGLSAYFAQQGLLPLFILLFIGFGSYAGFVPLHTWLPQTQLAAPSHVSGIMSGILIQMGIYGILRVLTYIHTDLPAIGLIVLAVSLLSGIVGIRYAFVQHDGKKLLAYSSIANTGIIGIGIGAGLLGIAFKMPALAALGFTGGILHIFNHALSKSVLFYSVGSIYRATHTRNIEQLGGLIKTMPKTSVAFLLGSLAICGLPPFNGFVSEFMIYLGLFKGLNFETGLLNISIWAVIIGLTVISGLTLFGFMKVFETAFLGNPHSEAAAHAKEVTDDMIMPKVLAGIGILAIGLLPTLFLKLTSKVTALYVTDLKPLDDVAPTLVYTGIAGAIIIGSTLLVLWTRNKNQKPVEVEYHQRNLFSKPKSEHWVG
jgi:hydrogenase-4 component B